MRPVASWRSSRRTPTRWPRLRPVEQWLDQPPVWIPEPTDRHSFILSRLLGDDIHGDLVPAAHLAALSIEHGLTVRNTDGDFARFPGVRWENPLRGI
jgi:predicted nucleic acid-binding protein